MADPTMVPAEAPGWLGDWAWRGLTALVGMLGIDTLRRTRRLELTTKTNEAAAAERAELKAELTAMNAKLEANRMEQKSDTAQLGARMDSQHSALYNRINELANILLEKKL